MKPILMTTCDASRRDSFDHTMCRHRLPITDYSYHSIELGRSSANYARGSARSFWNISGDYFKTKRDAIFWVKPRFGQFLFLRHFFP